MLAAAACAGWLLAFASPPAQVDIDPLRPSFRATLATYRGGDLWAAVAALGTVRQSDWDDVVDELWRRGELPQAVWARRIRTTMALLTEAWLVKDQKGLALPTDPLLLTARSIARTLVRMASARREGLGDDDRRFARDWYLLIVSYRHGTAQVAWSRTFLAEARDLFPGDADVLEVSGADHEIVSAVSKGYMPRAGGPGVPMMGDLPIDPARELEQAERYLRQAVALAPGMSEARLRLGRVLSRRGDRPGATQQLQAALTTARHDPLRYLAHTFLGMVAAAAGEFDAADGHYANALRLYPNAQAAMLARSEAAYLRGRSRDAAGMVMSVLQHGAKDDPWWLYLAGDWWHFEARLVAMRQDARRD